MPTLLNPKTQTCVLCGQLNSAPLYAERPEILRCSCGMVYTAQHPNKSDFGLLYNETYFKSDDSHHTGYDNYFADEALHEQTFSNRLGELQTRWNALPGRLLDVGCASGIFLSVAHRAGWEVEGVDISRFCVDYAQKRYPFRLHHDFFTDAPLTPGFSLITMWDYLEHSLTPEKDLELAYKLLSPGGLLALTTPDIGSFPAQIFKSRWMGLKQAEHLHYFKKSTLRRLLTEKRFGILHVSHAGKFVSADFFAKRLSQYSEPLSVMLSKALRILSFEKNVFFCNPMDVLFIVAQKE